MKEAPKFIYNANAFKNVKLAMSDDELKQDESIVEDVSKYLKDVAVEKLIKAL